MKTQIIQPQTRQEPVETMPAARNNIPQLHLKTLSRLVLYNWTFLVVL